MISFVGSAIVAGSSVTIPAHQAGDIIIITAFNRLNSIIPTLPDGWGRVASSSVATAPAFAALHSYKIAESSSEVSGTWTNATSLACVVYRDSVSCLNSLSRSGNVFATSRNITYPSMVSYTSNSSSVTRLVQPTQWVVGILSVSQNDPTALVSPSGMVARQTLANATVGSIGIFDTNGYVPSLGSRTVTIVNTIRYNVMQFALTPFGFKEAISSPSISNVFNTGVIE